MWISNKSKFRLRSLSCQPGFLLGFFWTIRLNVNVYNIKLCFILLFGENMLAYFVQILYIIAWETLTTKSLAKFLIFCIRVQMCYSKFAWITLKFVSSTINSVIIDDKNDTSHFISGKSLTLHSTKSKSTITHNINTP